MDKFSELKAAAMAATPGPWSINRTGNTIVSNHSHPVATVSDAFHRQLAGGGVGKDAEFIAAANPATVLALLAELEFEKQNNAGVAGMVEDYETKLEAKDDALRAIAFHVSAGGYNADSVDAEVFKQKIIDGINDISDIFVKRIAELEAIRSDASQVFKEIGNELGCNPDNESIMMAIDDMKATQMTGPLALIIKRAEEMERILEGITPEMIAGGWTAKGISDYAKSLEAKLATPVQLQNCDFESVAIMAHWCTDEQLEAWVKGVEHAKKQIRAAGFKVEGDE